MNATMDIRVLRAVIVVHRIDDDCSEGERPGLGHWERLRVLAQMRAEDAAPRERPRDN